jgi:hypothetical protein
MLWAPRADGAFLSCTIDRDQTVLGWAPHYTEGAVESMATIPNGDRDETWVIVRRTVNGATVRYIEIFDDTFEPLLPGAAPTGYPPYTEPDRLRLHGGLRQVLRQRWRPEHLQRAAPDRQARSTSWPTAR